MSLKKQTLSRVVTHRGTTKETLTYTIEGKEVDHNAWHRMLHKAMRETRATLVIDTDNHLLYDIYESSAAKQYFDKMKIWTKHNVKTKNYACPWCAFTLTAQIPYKTEMGSKSCWDTLAVCPACDNSHFRMTYPSGKIITNKMEKI